MADWVADWRTGEFEIFINENEKIWLFNKFYVKSEVRRDAQTIMKALLSTNETPYKMSLYLPALINRIRRDLLGLFEVTVNHNPGQMLEVVTNDRRFKGFRIERTGNGNELDFNGKTFILTENSLKTKPVGGDANMIKIN